MYSASLRAIQNPLRIDCAWFQGGHRQPYSLGGSAPGLYNGRLTVVGSITSRRRAA